MRKRAESEGKGGKWGKKDGKWGINGGKWGENGGKQEVKEGGNHSLVNVKMFFKNKNLVKCFLTYI